MWWIVFLCFILGGLYWRYAHRRSGEPPLVAGIWFWGVANEFGKNAKLLLQECKAKHGPVFTLVVAGQRMTMICDSSASSKFFRHNRLDFERFGYGVSEKAFGHTFQGSMAVAKTSKPLTTKNLLGSGLPALQVAFAKELYSLLGLPSSKKRDGLEQVQKLENGSWSLYDFISVLVFGSSTEALWGNGFYNAAVLDDFRSVDDAFILLIAGVPSFVPAVKKAKQARARLAAYIGGHTSGGAIPRPNISDYMMDRFDLFTQFLSPHDAAHFNVSILWAALANTIPAVFWTLLYILKHPKVLAAVQKELEDVRLSLKGTSGDDQASALATLLSESGPGEKSQTELLDSCVLESLRLSSASLVVRMVEEDTTVDLPAALGGPIKCRKGDQVCLVPILYHNNEEVYGEGSSSNFQPFRKWTKEETDNLMPFGGGVSMCPGRKLARSEIKLVVAALLLNFDLKLDAPDDPLPDFDVARASLGILPPAPASKPVGFTFSPIGK